MASIQAEQQEVRKDGPYGDKDAALNYDFQVDPKKKERISKIIIRSGLILDAIGFAKVDKDGNETHTKMFGGQGGTLNQIEIQLGEEITKITGKSRNSEISKLMIYTDNKPNGYGPYGSKDHGKDFTSNIKDEETVVGFFGSADDEDVSSIGLYAKQDN